MREWLDKELAEIDAAGLRKPERVLTTPQENLVESGGAQLINLCANNYLGLANHPRLRAAAAAALERWGYGLASVRFICGTQTVHKELEERIAAFVGTEAAILYSSCFDANTGLFETLLGAEDAVLSDTLNHASIIDGIRLCKARRLRYRSGDLQDLEDQLQNCQDCRHRLIVSDGVFSMDGRLAEVAGLRQLADRYDALLMVDDSHATGIVGADGRGSAEAAGVYGQVDIITGTFGKALGGASGGFTAAAAPLVELLRQRSRPYLFSNSLAPMIAATTLAALDLLESDPQPLARLRDHTRFFRAGMRQRGFEIPAGEHPIVPIMLGDARLAAQMSEALLARGIYAIGFSYPVVPPDAARIRVQISAAHTRKQLQQAIDAFAAVREQLQGPAGHAG